MKAIAPADVVNEFGAEAVRYYLLRHVHTTRDGDFSRERLVSAHDTELADQLGNLVHRTTSLIRNFRNGVVPDPLRLGEREQALEQLARITANEVAEAVEGFALHDALAAIWRLVAAGNRYVDETEPWRLGKADKDQVAQRELDRVLHSLAVLVRQVAKQLEPFLPVAASKIRHRFGDGEVSAGVRVDVGTPLFPKLRSLPRS